MTIEQKILELLKDNPPSQKNDISVWKHISNWDWSGRPISHYDNSCPIQDQVDILIQQTDPTECLTSNCEYIRECKKWHMENK